MCRAGLRHCAPRTDAERQRVNARRRASRHLALASAAHDAGDQQGEKGHLAQAAQARSDEDEALRVIAGHEAQALLPETPEPLTPQERDALSNYGGIEHYDLNEALRAGAGSLEGLDDDQREIVSHLDAALAKAPRTDAPRVLYRGIETLRVDGQGNEIGETGEGWVGRGGGVGSILTFHGYTSTTHDVDLAAGRFSGIRREYGRDGVVLAITTDRGHDGGGPGDEAEVLLPRGQRFLVTEVTRETFEGQPRPVMHLTHLEDRGGR